MYKVVLEFEEKNHNGHTYKVGDVYPKDGAEATKARLKELSSTKNKYKKVFIEAVQDKE
ncbi:termination factor Rho [Paenibacillus glucanolyticus]|uniref:termination factor Rho n=1 Tax=Paenibacillus glucanolyticus TaxID=59843 RepID=UPI00117F86D3|nr:termination factor Rho [Paenibacillus glucanolyticus]